MGKATRWFKHLLGLKKENEQIKYIDDLNPLPIDKKEKKRKSFAKSGKDSCDLLVSKPINDTEWKKCYSENVENVQNKHAIAVAAATAAAADAAVAAAQAAVAVVRLTSNGREFKGGREILAAMKIQSVFRGHLARKAPRALKALVKLQALVRGYIVRKRAAATLHSMQALIRAQTAVRTQRGRLSFVKECKIHPEIRARRSVGFDERINKFHCKRISASGEFDELSRVVEIDTINSQSRSKRINAAISESGEDDSYQGSSLPLSCPFPGRIPDSECNQNKGSEWSSTADECVFSTAHKTPRFANSSTSNAPMTPKSVCGDGYFRPCLNYPNYMASTQSFKAKLRSLSTPKQRPEDATNKRLSLKDMMAGRNSVSGVRI